MKKTIQLLFLLLAIQSCQYFEKQVPDEKELLKQELKKINWDEVDEFPSVLQCDTIIDAAIKKQCFFDYMAQTIQERIGIDTLRIEYPKIDTINVKITINTDSSLQFETQYTNDSIALADKTKIDSILMSRLSDFPKVEPAIKRGVKVKTQFVLPVIIKMEK
ncbi:MAG: hypothetical protein RSE15_07110 [Flavobacterium sp.]|jgi:hypothetical protein|uniref:hypothetical protein n=1 Tax=Flavobacterium sp. TaxID=239 RepID=UPI001B723B43|nr:hypothetical protein [Flavobacterium sp.]MBP9849459.1 hypothetical protein [Flavobacterium sp.]WRH72136.1 MAG: hypothetical protein RSE15_07110 [Flavobacterium sp.]